MSKKKAEEIKNFIIGYLDALGHFGNIKQENNFRELRHYFNRYERELNNK